jgi:PAS domain S-box-containing protein
MKKENKSNEELLLEVENLRAQLAQAEETLAAIRSGEVDALVITGKKGEQVFTLKGAEQPYRILIEEMMEGAVMLAADDTILYCNRGFAGMLKIPLEKIIGTGIAYYVAPADEAVFRKLLIQGKNKGAQGEIAMLAPDGTSVPAHLSINTLQLDDAPFVYMVATDLTGQKRIRDELRRARDELEIRVEQRTAELAKSEQLWATTLASIGDAVISTDTQGRVTFMNAVAEVLTGWTLAGALMQPLIEVFNIINGNTRQKADNPVARVLKEGMIVGLANHTSLVRKDGTEVPIDDSGAPIKDTAGKTMGVVLVFRDITERKKAEEALRESEQKFMKLFQGNAAAIALTRLRDRRIIEVNERWQEVFGFSREEVIGGIVNKIKLWKHPEEQMRAIRDLETHGAFRNRECEFLRKNGEGWTGLMSSEVIRLQGDGFILTSLVDITERKKAVEALRESEARFRSVLDNSQDVIYRLNVKTGRYEYISPSAETVVGFSQDELMALNSETSLAMIHPDDLPAMRAVLARLEDTGKGELEYRQRAKNGEYRWISNNMSLVRDSAGRPLYRNGNIRDITQRKRTEEALRKAHEELEQRVRERTAQLNESLEEKEILLREIHHRVKNNMQVISGLLMLQEEFSNDANIREILKESQNRIDSMALIHEKLYRSESIARVDFKEYINELVNALFYSYGINESKVGFKVNAENISMGIDTAIPCGLIINELVSNSLKHAFPAGKKGEIEMSLSSTGEDKIEISVRDNGVGIPEGIDFRKTESLGLHIVNILVENQLHGEITMNKNNGTEFRIRFKGTND